MTKCSRSIAFLLVLIFFCLKVNAQFKLSGTIVDVKGAPIAYATVAFQHESDAAATVQQTDSLGQFLFQNKAPATYQISVYALGYARHTSTVRLKVDTTIQISLPPLSGNLTEVTIVGNRPAIERKPDRVIFHVSEQISTAGTNGLELLKQVPGLKLSDNRISLAGKGEMSVKVNDRLLHLSEEALMNYLSSFSSDQIDRVEVITNPSSQYDAEGAAGIIHIVTKKKTDNGWSGNVSGMIKRFFYKDQPDYHGIKNYGDLDGGLGLYYNSERWSVYTNLNYLAGRELWGYGIAVAYPEKYWNMEDTGEYRIATFNLVAGADYRLNNHTTLGFEYNNSYHIEDGADYVNIPVYNPPGQLDSAFKTYATYLPIAKGNGFNLHLNQELNTSGAKMTLNADYFNFYRTDRSDFISQSYTEKGKLKEEATQQLYDTTLQNIKIYTFKADFTLPTSFAQIALGGKLSFIDNYSNIYYFEKRDDSLKFDKDLSNEFRYIENTQSLYAQSTKDMGKWKLEAGVRAELTQTKATSYFQDSTIRQQRLKLFPSFLANFAANEDHDFSFTYNKRIHRPTFWNLNPYKTFMTPYTYVEGNPYLEPEYISNLKLSHHYKNRLLSSVYMKVINNGFAQVIETQKSGKYTHITGMHNFIKSHRFGISESVSGSPFSWWETHNLFRGYYTKVHSSIDYIDGVSGWGAYLETANTLYFNTTKTISGYVGFWYQFPAIEQFGHSNAYYNIAIGLQMLTLKKRLTLSLHFNDLFQSSASKLTTTVDQVTNTYTEFQLNSQLRFSASWHFGQKGRKNKSTHTGNEAERERVN